MSNFVQWLGQLAGAMRLEASGELVRERTMVVNEAVCTFVHPCCERDDLAAVLIDAGVACTGVGREVAETALSRNLENFLSGAPLFFVNPSSRHLVLGQKFEYGNLDVAQFAQLVGALALQASAWQQKCGGAR